MDRQFWMDRWQADRIGFHLDEPNPALRDHWDALAVRSDQRVLVPLCGKTVDLHWLSRRGHPVLGIEWSPIAVRDFFAEGELTPRFTKEGRFEAAEAKNIRLLCGDFFDVTPEILLDVRAVYDRAAIVALPPDLRRRYADALVRALPRRVEILMVTFEYDQSEMEGPPFSVPEAEVRTLFAEAFSVERLSRTEADAPTRFAERGLTSFRELVFLLRR